MRLRTIAALAATLAFTTASLPGCSDDGDTIINQITGASPAAGNFPGAPSSSHDTAPDGFALSPAGVGVASAIRHFASGVGRRAITLYVVSDGTNATLYAHYYNGSTYSPPVALRGGNQDPTATPIIGDAAVLFINKAGDLRDGDALIYWRNTDLDDQITNNIGANKRLYFAYFDVSVSGQAASGTNGSIQYGFDTVATTVDTDDDTGADVTCFSVVSDGLHGMGTAIGDGFTPINQYTQGDPVSHAGVVYLQDSFANPAAFQPRFSMFNLAGSGNTMPAPSNLGMDGTFTAGTDTTVDLLASYDGSIFVLYQGGGDQNLVWNVFGSTAAPTGFLTTAHRLNPTDGGANFSGALNNITSGQGGVLGPDEGIVNIVGVVEVAGLSFATNRDLYAFQVDPATGAAPGASDVVEIDADTTNAGANPQVVTTQSIQGMINRTSEWVLVTWRQARGNSAANNGQALWSRAIQLTKTGTAPALTTRTSGSGAQQIDQVTTGNNATNDQVVQMKFQQEVAPGCNGHQSDRFAVHALWQQNDAANANDRVRTRRITFSPSAGASNPVSLTLGTERVELFNLAELANTGAPGSPGGWSSVIGTDGGGTGGTAGDLILYFVRDATVTSGTVPSFRAYQKIEGGSPIEIGSLLAGGGSNRECINLQVNTVTDSADLTGAPDFAGATHHVFLHEIRTGDPATGANNPTALRHRVFDKNSTATLTARFTPNIGSTTPPTEIDVPSGGNTSGAPAFTHNGTTVGIYFAQNGHFWYQQYTPVSGWQTSGGASAPELVDHDSAESFTAIGVGFNVLASDRCNTLNGFVLYWSKPNASAVNRWHARVRD